MRTEAFNLGIVLSVNDTGTQTLRRFKKTFEKTTFAVEKRIAAAQKVIGAGTGLLAASAVSLGGAFKLADVAGEFEQGLSAIGAITEASSKELNLLSDAATEAGIKTQFSPAEAVEGLTALATAGQKAADAVNTLNPALDLTAGSLGKLSVAQGAKAIVGTLNSYKMATADAGIVADKLLRITQISNFQAEDFESGLARAASTGAMFGETLDDVLVSMALMRNLNIDGANASTFYRNAIQRIAGNEKVRQKIQQAGVKVYNDENTKRRATLDIITDLSAATKKMGASQRDTLLNYVFGKRAVSLFNAAAGAQKKIMIDGREVTLTGAAAVAQFRKEQAKSIGVNKKFKKAVLDTFRGQVTLLKGTLSTIAIQAGLSFAKFFKPVVQSLVENLNELLRAYKALPEGTKSAIAKAFIFATVLTGLAGAVLVASGGLVLAASSAKVLAAALATVSGAIAPVIAVLGALALVGAAFKVADTWNLGGFSDTIERQANRAKLAIGGLYHLLRYGQLSDDFLDIGKQEGNSQIIDWVYSVRDGILSLGGIWDGIKNGFTLTIGQAAPMFQVFSDTIDSISQAFIDAGTAVTGFGGQFSGGVLSTIGNFIGKFFATIITGFLKFASLGLRFWGGIAEGFSAVKSTLAPALEALGSAINEIIAVFGELFGNAGLSQPLALADVFGFVGTVIGKVLGTVISGIAHVFAFVGRVIGGIMRIAGFVRDNIQLVGQFFSSVARVIKELVIEGIELIRPYVVKGLFALIRFMSPLIHLTRKIINYYISMAVWIKNSAISVGMSIAKLIEPYVSKVIWGARVAKRAFDLSVSAFKLGLNIIYKQALITFVRIKAVMQPFLDWLTDAGNAIKELFSGIADIFSRLADRVAAGMDPINTDSLMTDKDRQDRIRVREAVVAKERRVQSIDNAKKAHLASAPQTSDVNAIYNGYSVDRRPIQVQLDLDGQTVWKSTLEAEMDRQAREYSSHLEVFE